MLRRSSVTRYDCLSLTRHGFGCEDGIPYMFSRAFLTHGLAMNKKTAGTGSVADNRCPHRLSNRASELWHRLQLFMEEQVYPAEKVDMCT
jgi:hypothetical protein